MKVEDDVAAIRRQMAEVRKELQGDLKEAAESTRQLGDWRRYVRTFPAISLAAAFAAAYWIVPRRGPTLRITSDSPQGLQFAVPEENEKSNASLTRKVGSSVLGVAGKLAARYAIGFASAQLTKLLTQASGSKVLELQRSRGNGRHSSTDTVTKV